MKRCWIWILPLVLAAVLLGLSGGEVMAQDQAAPPQMPGMEPPTATETPAETSDEQPAEAPEKQPTVVDAMFTASNLWMMVCTGLVFIMHLGFATLESGLTRAKNSVNVLFKNTMIPAIGLLTYALCGFALMYPDGHWLSGSWLGYAGWGITIDAANVDAVKANLSPAYADYTYYTDFLFQGMFAATAATIVSGAVAERIKLNAFLIFSVIFVAISYPITGSWFWGEGWLLEMNFHDFAGSTLVHAVGGTGALIAAIILGPRLGKYVKDGGINPIPGHNMAMATTGGFLLWLGWFGFNGGSVLSADPAAVSKVLVTTSMAAAAGGLAAALVGWTVSGKPDLSMALNGILAGLVGITAGADLMSVQDSIIIGLIAGAIVYFSVLGLDRLRIDDPVGAVSVHLVCGIWGTLAVGMFGDKAGVGQIGTQVVGILAVCGFTAVFVAVILFAIKSTMGLRVTAAEEIEGLDLGEHDMAAYPDFQQTYIKSYHAREI